MMRHRKNLAWRIAASLAAGVVLTVAVAWGATLWTPGTDIAASDRRPQRWPSRVPASWPASGMQLSEISGWGTRGEFWGAGSTLDRDDDFILFRRVSGWPFDALVCQSFFAPPNSTPIDEGAMLVPAWMGVEPFYEYAAWNQPYVPLVPVWPGFALSTAFYGGIIFLLWSAPGVLRRRSRSRCGLCIACGYDLKGSAAGPVCPECGA